MTAIATPHHRVSVATASVRSQLEAVADASVWSMDEAETAQTLIELSRAKAQIAELEARVAAHADDLHVGQDVAASSAATWLAHQTKQTRTETHRAVQLGHDLEVHPLTRDALAGAAICADQARVIVQAVDRLPADVRPQAEAHLLNEARHHDAKTLRILGKRLYEVVDPDAADAREAALLEREEAAAMKTCRLTLHDDGHGTTHLRGQIPTLQGAALRKMLAAITAPKHQRAAHGAGVERLPGPEAMGRAFCELISRYPVKKLPRLGGLNATLVVTITEDSLMGRVEQAAVLDTGERISPGAARRLLCEAGVIPVVLGGDSMPIDVGRERGSTPSTTASPSKPVTRAAGPRAATEGSACTPTTRRWADGGTTTVDRGIALCPWHHSRIHDTGYEATKLPTGKVAFHRRT